jgi:hypothetical protein
VWLKVVDDDSAGLRYLGRSQFFEVRKVFGDEVVHVR